MYLRIEWYIWRIPKGTPKHHNRRWRQEDLFHTRWQCLRQLRVSLSLHRCLIFPLTSNSQVQIAKDPEVYPNPEKVCLDRPIDSYIVYGMGPHQCLGGEASRVALTAMLKVVGRLDNLRRTPGPQGEMKKIPRPGGFYIYMDALESTYSPFPTTMKVQWDGGLNEPKWMRICNLGKRWDDLELVAFTIVMGGRSVLLFMQIFC